VLRQASYYLFEVFGCSHIHFFQLARNGVEACVVLADEAVLGPGEELEFGADLVEVVDEGKYLTQRADAGLKPNLAGGVVVGNFHR